MTVSIRLADLNDAERITHLNISAWKQSFNGVIDSAYLVALKPEDRIEPFRRMAIMTELHCFVAEKDNQIVGFCHAGPTRVFKETVKGEVWTFYVRNEYQKQGIGLALWNRAVAYLQDKKFSPYIVCVLAENISARKFYEKSGGFYYQTKKRSFGDKEYDEVCYIFN